MNIKEALNKALPLLEGLEYINPHNECRNILSYLLQKDTSYLFAHSDEELPKEVSEEFFKIINKRQKGYPLQYILGSTEFFGRNFKVNENVLIPRQDTEISVENILKVIESDKLKSMLDIGTGSGIVAITVKLETGIETYACDISRKALEVSMENAKNLEANVNFIESDLFKNINKKFDIIYSNPPYIKSKIINTLQIEVKDFEPKLALDGGEDGLYFYKKIIKDAPQHLNKNGYLIFEIGHDQAEEIENLMEDRFNTQVIKDLSNLDRVIVGKMRG